MAKRLSNAERNEKRTEAIAHLREMFRDYQTAFPGTDLRLYVRVTAVARSGMSAALRAYVVTGQGTIANVTYYAALAAGHSLRERDGEWQIVSGGCGFSRSGQLAYDLSAALYPTHPRPGYVIAPADL